ncbi:hypothetical protein ACFU0X_31580 [Streptomyces cellulosae]|uniref:DNA primase/polymerase bifunctional N-terminal domain-containing protein n=1 Tax=Streptomyces cellulosae TaxID=1968 RepID=A0ABW6JQ41_STRCE
MTPNSPALRPVQTSPGVLVHPTADRRLAAEQWLSTAHLTSPAQARREWRKAGMALLHLGALFSAVRIPLRLALAPIGGKCPSREADEFLAYALEDGPVICDPAGRRYYALVPASMPTTWHVAAAEWREDEVDCLGRDVYLGVPRLDRTSLEAGLLDSYWSVPMASAGSLCASLAVARLIAAGKHALAEEGGLL